MQNSAFADLVVLENLCLTLCTFDSQHFRPSRYLMLLEHDDFAYGS